MGRKCLKPGSPATNSRWIFQWLMQGIMFIGFLIKMGWMRVGSWWWIDGQIKVLTSHIGHLISENIRCPMFDL